jgi:hypothetical protein
MIATLAVMITVVLAYGFKPATITASAPSMQSRVARHDRVAVAVLLGGVALSSVLFLGFKNRPGAYQGSPSFYMDPSQADRAFDLNRIAVPQRAPMLPASAAGVQQSLAAYARTLDKLLEGYYILDRNYNYHFHNELFLRSTPLRPNYRRAGLKTIETARQLRVTADASAAAVRTTLAADDPLGVLLDDMRAYVAYNFERAATLERMSAEFERTKAGLQHATHLYEGEAKFLGLRLAEILTKHQAVLDAASVRPVTGEFVAISRAIHDAYANRIVGF